MTGRRRGARTGRGWDAAPPRPGRDAARHRNDGDRPRRPDALSPGEGAGDGDPGRDERRPEQDEAQRARDICLRQLAVRPRTRAELADTLARRGISAEVAERVLDRYDEVGMVDDAAFARAWVSSRHHGRGLARRALAGELRRRGVAGEIVGDALDQVDEETEAATARALVERKLRSSRGEPQAVFRRLVAMLARKGYPPGLAVTVVKEALADAAADGDSDEVEAYADQVEAYADQIEAGADERP